MENKLEQARHIINEVDSQMAELFVKRMKAAEMVYEHKKEYGLPILDSRVQVYFLPSMQAPKMIRAWRTVLG